MPEYCSYNGAMRDPTEKHVIENGRIDTYKRDSVLFVFPGRWKLSWSFKIDHTTKILDEHVGDDGCGWAKLENADRKYTFYVYKYASAFIRELKSRGFP